MAYIFDTRRVQPSGLACELVVPPEWLDEIAEDALTQQFARTPYGVSFRTGSTTCILVTLHVDWGDSSADRIPELKGIARWLREWARRENKWHHNLITLGDFNIDREGDALWDAFTSTGLTVPDELNAVKRSIFAKANDPAGGKYYDQIAWFTRSSGIPYLDLPFRSAGSFDFIPHVYSGYPMSKRSLSYRLSDHYPLWVEFGL